MAKKTKPYPRVVKGLLAEKTAILSKARALSDMGMTETAIPLWMAAASFEERLAPFLEALGRDREAAIHRISAASCYQKAGDPGRAINLYRAALAGPLREEATQEVRQMLTDCLSKLMESSGSLTR
jgi:hypothetical protein